MMRKRFFGAIAGTAAILFTLHATGAQQRAPQPAATPQPATPAARPARIGGKPNFNGIWQATNGANWNLEAHSAEQLKDFWKLGAIGAIPAGKSVLKGGGTIPYLPAALARRNENRAKWPATDPEAKCFMLGIPRYTYHGMPFQIFQGAADADMLMVYPFAAGQRVIHLKDHTRAPVDSWMGKSGAVWEGDVLVVTTADLNEQTWLDRAGNHHSNKLKVVERFRLIDPDHIQYEATLEDPETYSRPWTIEMPLYRMIDPNAQLLEHKCVPFADNLLYEDLLKPKP